MQDERGDAPDGGPATARERILARERRLIASLTGARADADALEARTVARFRRLVRDHYACCGRDLPWRHDTDPYGIVVSEVMLQQTQVPRVVDRYPRFLARFPDWRALASAPLAEVLDEWQGLGYNRRALSLKRAAEEVVSRHGGELPADRSAIEALPGIGADTAAAVLVYAFGVPAVYVETNVRAVMLHVFFPDETAVADRDLLPYVERTLDRSDPRTWYWALMDYGAWLKRREVNPSRRSRHHVRQSAFAGSTREARGAVLRALVDRGAATEAQLAEVTGLPRDRVASALRTLSRDGLAVERGGVHRIP